MSSEELTLYITAVANVIACNYSVEELNLLGIVLSQLSVTLTTIAAQRSALSELCNSNTQNSDSTTEDEEEIFTAV